MKKLLAVTLIVVHMASLVFAAVPAESVADALSPSGSVTVYNLSALFTVVMDNTMQSLKEIAALAGLAENATPPAHNDNNAPADKAAANPACISQFAKTNFDVKSSSKMVARCDTPLTHTAMIAIAAMPGSCAWLFFGCGLLLIYRLKLFYYSARGAIDYQLMSHVFQGENPRFVRYGLIGDFLLYRTIADNAHRDIYSATGGDR